MFVSDSLSQATRDVQFPNEESAFGVNGIQTPEMREALRIATEQNAQLIKSLARQHCDAIASKVYANVQAGARPSSLVSEIRDYGATKARAKFIARDQTAKVMSTISRVRQQAAGFRYFRWSTSHDERVRQEHRDVANRITPYGKGVYAWDDLPVIHGERLAPGGDFQCFPASVKVNVYAGVEKLFRRRYSGELVTLVADNGVILRATPNHPVLRNSKEIKFTQTLT